MLLFLGVTFHVIAVAGTGLELLLAYITLEMKKKKTRKCDEKCDYYGGDIAYWKMD